MQEKKHYFLLTFFILFLPIQATEIIQKNKTAQRKQNNTIKKIKQAIKQSSRLEKAALCSVIVFNAALVVSVGYFMYTQHKIAESLIFQLEKLSNNSQNVADAVCNVAHVAEYLKKKSEDGALWSLIGWG